MLSFLRIVPAAILAAGIPGSAVAETLKAVPEQSRQAVDRAQDGDVIELAPGQYNGAIRIERRVAPPAESRARRSTAAGPAMSSP